MFEIEIANTVPLNLSTGKLTELFDFWFEYQDDRFLKLFVGCKKFDWKNKNMILR
jgi:hypothetical protein